jgi:hypothetical protein
MKQVSWEFAFRKLKEWKGKECVIGSVVPMESQGETISMFRSTGWPPIVSADSASGTVTLADGRTISLIGAAFRFSTYEDSPFGASGIGSADDFQEQLESTFPDGRILVFVLEDEYK